MQYRAGGRGTGIRATKSDCATPGAGVSLASPCAEDVPGALTSRSSVDVYGLEREHCPLLPGSCVVLGAGEGGGRLPLVPGLGGPGMVAGAVSLGWAVVGAATRLGCVVGADQIALAWEESAPASAFCSWEPMAVLAELRGSTADSFGVGERLLRQHRAKET